MKKLMILVSLCLCSCLVQPVHQGNVIDKTMANQIKIGESRTSVESRLGTPILKTFVKNQAIYIEDVKNKDTDELYQRRIEITYDRAGTVKKIQRQGFEN